MKRRKSGRPRAVDRDRYPSDQVKPSIQDIASPFAVAKRAVLTDPMAAEESLARAKRVADDAKETFGHEDAARAVARSLPAGRVLGKDEAESADYGRRASTAIGRYWLWARWRAANLRLGEEQYQAALSYASLHGAFWGGLKDELTVIAEEGDGALAVGGIIVPRRHPPAQLGKMVERELPGDLAPTPTPSAEEWRERRNRLRDRYRSAREALAAAGDAALLAVEELVIEDHDPWWIEPAPQRLGEREAKARAGEVLRQRRLLAAGLDALAAFFGMGQGRQAPHTAAQTADRKRRRWRLDVVLGPMDRDIDLDTITAAARRLKEQIVARRIG